MALKRKGGGDDIEFYDVETGLKAGGIVDAQEPDGHDHGDQSALSDYKKFGDILQPTVIKQTATGIADRR